MADQPPKRVYSRPPVDGTDEDWDRWANDFAEAILGPTPADEGSGESDGPPDLTDPGALLDVEDYDPADDCGDLFPTPDMIATEEWYNSLEDEE